MGIYLLISNSLFFPFVKPFVLKMPFSIVVEISMSIVAEISLYTCGNNLYTRGNIFVYSWKYLGILLEISLYTRGNLAENHLARCVRARMPG